MSEPGTPPESVRRVVAAISAGHPVSRQEWKAAVKTVLSDLSALAPGRSVEVRVPPYAAVQVVAGATHRRGTPPALVQMQPMTLLRLATGDAGWAEAVAAGEIRASGERSDLSSYFPLYR